MESEAYKEYIAKKDEKGEGEEEETVDEDFMKDWEEN